MNTATLVYDVETVGPFNAPLVYDIGGAYLTPDGRVEHEFHFCIKEVFSNLKLMATAYYAENFGTYLQSIRSGDIRLVPFSTATYIINDLAKLHDVQAQAAYNLTFDKRAMEHTAEALTGNPKWLERDLKEICIMCAACDVLYDKLYCQLARARGWVTPKGNIKTTAECGYRFVSGNYDFQEAHMGLNDVQAEIEIFRAVEATGKPYDGTPRAFPFRQVWKREG